MNRGADQMGILTCWSMKSQRNSIKINPLWNMNVCTNLYGLPSRSFHIFLHEHIKNAGKKSMSNDNTVDEILPGMGLHMDGRDMSLPIFELVQRETESCSCFYVHPSADFDRGPFINLKNAYALMWTLWLINVLFDCEALCTLTLYLSTPRLLDNSGLLCPRRCWRQTYALGT